MQLYPQSKKILHREKLTELYEETYNLYTKDAYRILGSLEEARDVIQEVFLKIYDRSDLTYRICGMDKPAACRYIRTMVHNESCSRRRKRLLETEEPSEADSKPDTDKTAEGLLNHILKSLPLEERILVTAYYKHSDLTIDDLANMTGLSHSTVSRRLRHARSLLRQEMQKLGLRCPISSQSKKQTGNLKIDQ